ncbi:MAG: phospho-N-acetylmuramoyl-pentapeptide-transferase [Prevotella sp.]|nr:phospho-N-acetylmuramoyl-pentapeptide-transferase [Prevotella sp.]
MVYYLFRFLEHFGVSGAGLWSYISFRALLALIFSLIISAWFGEKFIKYLKKKQITETQRDAKIDPFGVNKVGVPSMGGIIIIVSILIPVLLLGRLRNIYLILMIITTVWLGFLGGMDDYIKIFHRNKEGLKGKYKIVGQLGIGLIVGLVLWASPDVKINENINIENKNGQEIVVKHREVAHKSLKTTIPFIKGHNLDYSKITSFFGKHKVAAGWVLFVFMTILVVTAVSNGANLNDGMDGMCAGNSAIIGVALGILAYVSSHIQFAAYLNIMYIPGSQELVVFMCAFIGALIGFLWYNAYPAQVFMGDTGSLTIGGIIGVCAVIIHKELLLPILCGIFFVESLSVIVQVWYYKLGKRRGVKQRIFKRTPIHDNFRMTDSQLEPDCKYLIKSPTSPKHESKITIRFWIITIILAAFTIITLKIR